MTPRRMSIWRAIKAVRARLRNETRVLSKEITDSLLSGRRAWVGLAPPAEPDRLCTRWREATSVQRRGCVCEVGREREAVEAEFSTLRSRESDDDSHCILLWRRQRDTTDLESAIRS